MKKPLLHGTAGILPAWAPAAMVSAPRGRVALPDGLDQDDPANVKNSLALRLLTFDFETFDPLPLQDCRRARQECRASLASHFLIHLSSN
jgi:hypothetical protein